MTPQETIIQELFTAIQQSEVEQVKRLLTHEEIDLEQKNPDKQRPLTLACSIGNPEIIELLINAGAQVNVPPQPLVFNPQITIATPTNKNNLSELIQQATADETEEVKNFYEGFTSIVNALSVNETISPPSNSEAINEADESEDSEEDEDYQFKELGTTPLEAAVLSGDIKTVKTLLKAGADPNSAPWYETPVLVTAARKGNVEIVKALIAAGANPNRGCDKLPLHTAAENGHLEVVRSLLNAGADVEGHEEDAWTALMAASLNGNFPIVKLLVERGADVNAWSQGETPLMLAARGVQRDIYEFLYPLVCDKIRAIGDRDGENEMAKTLRRQKREENKGYEKLVNAAMYGKIAQVQKLIASGVEVNAISACGRTALSLAIQGGYIPVIQALLDAGADPNLPDETDDGLPDDSPLMIAATTIFTTNRVEMVHLLLKRGAEINQQDSNGKTVLIKAIESSNIDVIETLIKAGADLDIEDYDGNTALMIAEIRKKTKVAQILQQAGASNKGLKEVELIDAIDTGDIETVKILLQQNLNLNARVYGTTALCKAASQENHQIAQLLIAAGADVNQRISDGYFNPLLEAASIGNLEVVRVLLEAGADVNVRVGYSRNPLEYAESGKQKGHDQDKPFDEIIALLKSYGATTSG